jgi:hypothetical protein
LKCCTCHAKTAITCGSKKKSLAAAKNERSYCHKRLGHLTARSEVRAKSSNRNPFLWGISCQDILVEFQGDYVMEARSVEGDMSKFQAQKFMAEFDTMSMKH